MFRLQRLSTSTVLAHRFSHALPHGPLDSVSSDASTNLVAEMQAYYARRAEVYDASMGYEDPDVVRSLEPVMQALRDAMHDRIVLEVACGPGFWTTCLAESARFILATDYNEAVLSLARAKPIDPLRAHFVCVDAYDLSSIETTFTGAFAVDWLAHVPLSRLRPFLDGLHRRLAPGAHVAFCDQTPGPSSLTGQHDADGNHLQERILSDGSKHRVIKHFFSDDELRAILAPYTNSIEIQRFDEQRRLIVHYTI